MTTLTPVRSRRAPSLGRLLPSLWDFAFLIPVFFIFGRMNGARALLGDADTGWHVRTGEWILAHHRVPTQDLFSFTRPDQPWFAWEWLSDILMALAHRAGGMQAVILGSVLLLCVTVLLLFRLVLRSCGNVPIAFAITAIAAAGSSIHWLARPHLFTLLFIVVFYTALETRPARRLWFLPLLTVLWTNLHGGFFIGIVLVGAYALSDWITALSNAGEMRASAWRRGNTYAIVAAACLAASFLNPYTWHLHQHLIDYLLNPGYFEEIQEFLPLSFHHPLAHYYELMLFLAAGAAFFHLWKGKYSAFILIALWAHLSLPASRNIPVFLFIAAPPTAFAVAESIRLMQRGSVAGAFRSRYERLSELLARTGLRPSWHIFSVLALLAVGCEMYAPVPAPLFVSDYNPALYPQQALKALHPADRIFTDDEWGDYLLYHSSPPRRVFVDGRSDFYGPDFEKLYLDILKVRGTWKNTLNTYRVDTILARSETALCGALRESSAWTVTYDDGIAVIFRRSSPVIQPTVPAAF